MSDGFHGFHDKPVGDIGISSRKTRYYNLDENKRELFYEYELLIAKGSDYSTFLDCSISRPCKTTTM